MTIQNSQRANKPPRKENVSHGQDPMGPSLEDVMRGVAGSNAPPDTLKTILKNVLELMDAFHGFYYHYDDKTDTLVLKIGAGIYQRKTGYAIKKGDGLVGKVWEKEAPLVVNDYPAWPGRHPDSIWDRVSSAAGVPLKSKGLFLGVIGVVHTENDRQIDALEIHLLSQFAKLISLWIDNAQLYTRLEEELQKRQRIEHALTESEERYRSVVEDLTEFVLRWKPDGRVLFANDRYCRYKNKTKPQITGRNVKALFSKPAYEQAMAIIAQLTPEKPLQANDILTRGPDNRPIWEEWTDRGVFDRDGRLIEIQSVGRNITERKLAEKALRESEYRFRSFFNSNPEGIILVGLDGRVLDANLSLLKFTGYRIEELRGKSYKALVHADYHPQITHNIDALQKGLVHDEVLEIEYLSKGGARVPVSVRGWVITDEDSKPVALGGFIRDITRERQLAAEKSALEKQLQQTQKMEAIGTLAGGIAHDFNNILAGILGYTELALSESEDAGTTLKHYLSGVLDASHRARSLVKQILRFSRQDDTELTPLSVAPLLKETVKLLNSTLPATIRIVEDIAPAVNTVVADATQLHQVIMNLGTNAYHAMRATGGVLTFTLQNIRLRAPKHFLTLSLPPGDYVKLAVSDTGPGIPAHVLDRIFEPYFTTKEIQEGTGLGLSVTFGIVKSLKGLIEVEHTSPGSTTFAVYLPQVGEQGADVPNTLPGLPRGNNESILCVDDESAFLEVVQTHLEGLGYRVRSFESSVAALERFRQTPAAFDLVIADQTMPEMTGIELIARIREHRHSIPVILCTGYSEVVTAKTGAQYGISDFMMKPVPLTELARTVHAVLNKNRS